MSAATTSGVSVTDMIYGRLDVEAAIDATTRAMIIFYAQLQSSWLPNIELINPENDISLSNQGVTGCHYAQLFIRSLA